RRILIAITLIIVVTLSSMQGFLSVWAWKPTTHLASGNDAYTDLYNHVHGIACDTLCNTPAVTIDGRDYAVPMEIANAILNYPAYYRSGVVGPDGFPDIYFGQELLHPDNQCTMGTDSACTGPSYSGCSDIGINCATATGPV